MLLSKPTQKNGSEVIFGFLLHLWESKTFRKDILLLCFSLVKHGVERILTKVQPWVQGNPTTVYVCAHGILSKIMLWFLSRAGLGYKHEPIKSSLWWKTRVLKERLTKNNISYLAVHFENSKTRLGPPFLFLPVFFLSCRYFCPLSLPDWYFCPLSLPDWYFCPLSLLGWYFCPLNSFCEWVKFKWKHLNLNCLEKFWDINLISNNLPKVLVELHWKTKIPKGSTPRLKILNLDNIKIKNRENNQSKIWLQKKLIKMARDIQNCCWNYLLVNLANFAWFF